MIEERNKIMSSVCKMGFNALDEISGDSSQVLLINAVISSALCGKDDNCVRELSDVVDIESKHDAELGSEYEDILGILEPVYFSFFF